MTDDPARGQDSSLFEGQGARLALLRLYDEMADAQKQELLRFAVRLRRQHLPPLDLGPDQPMQPADEAHADDAPEPADSARAAVTLSGPDAPARLAALAAEWRRIGDAERAAHFAAAAGKAKALLAEAGDGNCHGRQPD